jgi:hypothetical protein
MGIINYLITKFCLSYRTVTPPASHIFEVKRTRISRRRIGRTEERQGRMPPAALTRHEGRVAIVTGPF